MPQYRIAETVIDLITLRHCKISIAFITISTTAVLSSGLQLRLLRDCTPFTSSNSKVLGVGFMHGMHQWAVFRCRRRVLHTVANLPRWTWCGLEWQRYG